MEINRCKGPEKVASAYLRDHVMVAKAVTNTMPRDLKLERALHLKALSLQVVGNLLKKVTIYPALLAASSR